MDDAAENELPPDGKAIIKDVDRIFTENALLEAGGYIPPDGNPYKCEPVPGDSQKNKGGFYYRVENKAEAPFNRCDRINCQVKDRCTELVQGAAEEIFNNPKAGDAIKTDDCGEVTVKVLNADVGCHGIQISTNWEGSRVETTTIQIRDFRTRYKKRTKGIVNFSPRE